MSSADYLKKWSWNCICDRCGKKAKAEELKLEWDGLRVCQRCYEIRQPQDFVRGQVDRQAPPWTRPEAPDMFVTPQCSYLGVSAIPGYAQPGCVRPSYVSPEIPTLPVGPFCTVQGSSGTPAYAIPNCFIPGIIYPDPDVVP